LGTHPKSTTFWGVKVGQILLKTTKIGQFYKVPELRTLHGKFDPQKEDFRWGTRKRPFGVWGQILLKVGASFINSDSAETFVDVANPHHSTSLMLSDGGHR
jgi:hypothetical protein